MVLNTQAGNQHGFDTLLPFQALSVHVSWVNCLSSHRRNPGFWCSSLSQEVVRNHRGFWAWSLWMCHPGNRLHLQEWVMSWAIGGWFLWSASEQQKSLIDREQRRALFCHLSCWVGMTRGTCSPCVCPTAGCPCAHRGSTSFTALAGITVSILDIQENKTQPVSNYRTASLRLSGICQKSKHEDLDCSLSKSRLRSKVYCKI